MKLCFAKDAAEGRLAFVLKTCLLLLIGCITLLSLVPPVSRDALVHHLNIPKLYLHYGKMAEFPSMSFSYFPMNLDLLYMIPLGFGNDIAPKFIHFSFALFTAWLIHGYLKPRTGRNYALIGALFFLSIPIIVKLSITVYVDLGLICFSTVALLLLFRWVETGFGFKFLIGSAVCCGLAMGTKYNGLIVWFLLTAFVPCIYSARNQNLRHQFIKSIGYGVLYLSVSLMVFSPWMIRNWDWKGNPIYPLYNSVFNPPKKADISPEQPKQPKAAKGLFTYRSIVYEETKWQMLLLPVRIFFEGEDGNGRYFDGKLNPFLLIFTVLAFIGTRRSRKHQEFMEPERGDQNRWLLSQKKILLAFSVLYFLFALFSTVLRIRYISPIIPPLVILSVFGMKNSMDILKSKLRQEHEYIAGFAGGAILVVCLGLNVNYLWTQFNVVDPISYLAGKVSRDEYITRYRPEYPVMQYANKNLLPDDRILFMFMGKRGYYCDRAYVLDSSGSTSLLMKIVSRSDTPEEIASALRKSGITHMMFQSNIFNRWMTEDLPEEKRGLFKAFLGRYAKLIYSHHLYGLVALASPEE